MTGDRADGTSVTELFSGGAESRLRAAGWSEKRSVPTSDLVASLTAEGYLVTERAAALLDSLTGIRIADEHRTRFVFGANAALSSLDPGSAALIREFFREEVCPIGHGMGLVMLLGESGRALLLGDQWLGYYVMPLASAALDWAICGTPIGSPWIELADADVPAAYRTPHGF